jgi:alpha-ribazole phosphatase/probable phosphoglycerate mutase
MVTIKYFVHGTSIDNETKISSGWSESDLSETGVIQTRKLADDISNEHFDIVYCSDLQRARQSTDILFHKRSLEIIYDQRLRECNYGIYNGTSHKNIIYLDHISDKFPQGESLLDVQSRIADLLNELRHKHKGKKIAFISHRAPQLALDVIINKKTWIEVINTDWRVIGKWQPGWEFLVE